VLNNINSKKMIKAIRGYGKMERIKPKITTKISYDCLKLETNDLYQILLIMGKYFEKYELKFYDSKIKRHNNSEIKESNNSEIKGSNNSEIKGSDNVSTSPFMRSKELKLTLNQDNAIDYLENASDNKKFHLMDLSAENSNGSFKFSLDWNGSFIEFDTLQCKGIVLELEDIILEKQKIFGNYHYYLKYILINITLVILLILFNIDPILLLICAVFINSFLFLSGDDFLPVSMFNQVQLNKLSPIPPISPKNDFLLPEYFTIYKNDILDIVDLLGDDEYSIVIGDYLLRNEDNISESIKIISDEDGEIQSKFSIETKWLDISISRDELSFFDIEEKWKTVTGTATNPEYIHIESNDLYKKGAGLEIRDIFTKRKNKTLTFSLSTWLILISAIVVTAVNSYFLITSSMPYLVNVTLSGQIIVYIIFAIGIIFMFSFIYSILLIIYYSIHIKQRNIILYNYNKRPLIRKNAIVLLLFPLIASAMGMILYEVLKYVFSLAL